jgi:hypothetical protein
MKVGSDVFTAKLVKYIREHVVDIEQHSNIGTMDELQAVFISALSRMATPDVRIVNVNCDFYSGDGNAILLVSKGTGMDSRHEGTAQLITNGGAIIYGYTWDESLHGEWQPITWEYANPSNMEGVEYRTTERYNGKPVYIKRREVEMGEDGTTRMIPLTTDATEEFEVVSIDAVCIPPNDNYPLEAFPVVNQGDGTIAATCTVTVEKESSNQYSAAINVRSFVDMRGHIATVTVKYTK